MPRLCLVLTLMLAYGLAGCGVPSGPWRPPSAPSPVPQAGPPPTAVQPTLRVFRDATSGFATSDVRDVHEQIVQFNTLAELIWTADGTHVPGFPAGIGTSNFIAAEPLCQYCAFEIRFGTKDGDRRAYLTVDYGHDNPGTIVDLELIGGKVVMNRTDVPPPGTFAISGVVFEMTPTGREPVEGAYVSRSNGPYASTDQKGFYTIPGLYAGTTKIAFGKQGYKAETRDVSIASDTRLELELVRQ